MNITNNLLLFTILGHINCQDFVRILKFLDKPECEHSGANLSIQQTRNGSGTFFWKHVQCSDSTMKKISLPILELLIKADVLASSGI